jgi:2-keto-4-pentenoate hydratase/2-oxohepta-3-ene-1,7-dioic acid hydratase in catechol pathway
MKLVTYEAGLEQRLGLWHDSKGILDVVQAGRRFLRRDLPQDMLSFIEAGSSALDAARDVLEAARQDAWRPSAGVKLCAPIPRMRKNVFCVGRNYKLHIEEGARLRGVPPTFPKLPEFFSKPPTAVIGNDDDIEWDSRATQQLDYEVEFGMVIGRRAKNLTEASALEAVFGYTVINDVSARDAQFAHGMILKGKAMDTFCPIGPCIVTADEFGSPSGHRLTTKINGAIRQDSNTSDLLFSCEQILMWLSRGLTLEPGDMIATGTPSGVAFGMKPPAWMQDGDVCEVEVEGIGILRNKVRGIA